MIGLDWNSTRKRQLKQRLMIKNQAKGLDYGLAWKRRAGLRFVMETSALKTHCKAKVFGDGLVFDAETSSWIELQREFVMLDWLST